MQTANYRFQLRRGSAAEWTADNPVLLSGEPGVESDTYKLKIGNGVAAWNDLAYFPDIGSIVSGVASVDGRTGIVLLNDLYSALVHAHAMSDVTGLVTALAGKAASVHTHAEGDVTNLVTDLAGKAASSHSHAESEVTNLTTDLASKAASDHSHASLPIVSATAPSSPSVGTVWIDLSS